MNLPGGWALRRQSGGCRLEPQELDKLSSSRRVPSTGAAQHGGCDRPAAAAWGSNGVRKLSAESCAAVSDHAGPRARQWGVGLDFWAE